MQFFPADYLRDTEILSLSAQGGWMRMLCSMWHPTRRGVLSLRLQAMARLLHASEQTTKSIIEEIEDCEVGAVEWSEDGERVTITCRRIVRDWESASHAKADLSDKRAEAARIRWAKQRQGESNANAYASAEQLECPPESRSQNRKESESVGANHFHGDPKTIVDAYPRREKVAEALAVVARLLADGEDYEAMLAGTRACAAVIRTLPSGPMNRYVPSADTFFRLKRWNDDPETFRRQGNQSSGQGQMSLEDAAKSLGRRAVDPNI